jgi:hypothetical protein
LLLLSLLLLLLLLAYGEREKEEGRNCVVELKVPENGNSGRIPSSLLLLLCHLAKISPHFVVCILFLQHKKLLQI